jgi:hypothetical protein
VPIASASSWLGASAVSLSGRSSWGPPSFSEIRSAPVSNEACIAIANRTGNVADFRHSRRRIRIGYSVGYFVYAFFGHES